MTHTKRFIKVFSRDNFSKAFFYVCLLGLSFLLVLIAHQWNRFALLQPVQDFVFTLEDSYKGWLSKQSINNPLILMPLAFGGGLLASISPCILSLLPVNVSYIGTREITSRRDAVIKAGSFVLGVITVLSLFGLFSALAASVIIQFRGYFNIMVGAIILIMGLNLLKILPFSLPQTNFKLPINSPYSFGLTFALVSSPCSSPVLISILTAAAATGSQIQSILTMISYALGYTAVIFLASLFAGLVKQTRSLLKYSEKILQIGAVFLILAGIYYLSIGIRWFILVMMNG